MRYKVLSQKGQELARAAIGRKEAIPDLTEYESAVGYNEPLDEKILAKLADEIRRRLASMEKKGAQVSELDAACFDLVHSAIPREPLLVGDFGFWTRFAINELADVIYKRFPGRKGQMSPANFGLGHRTECWPYKLWVRGELSFQEGIRDPYALGRLGKTEFWTSHVHRQAFMNNRTVLHSVLNFQYPKGKALLWEGEEDPKKKGKSGVRTLIKRLCENWASVEYALLSETEATTLVRSHSRGLHRTDGKAVFA